jgi:hypothetical protein
MIIPQKRGLGSNLFILSRFRNFRKNRQSAGFLPLSLNFLYPFLLPYFYMGAADIHPLFQIPSTPKSFI